MKMSYLLATGLKAVALSSKLAHGVPPGVNLGPSKVFPVSKYQYALFC